MVSGSMSASNRVEIVLRSPSLAVVSLVGEHDLSSKESMIDALAGAVAHPCVVVDFSRCTFADSTVVGVLVALSGAPACAIRLVVPDAARTVRRTFEMLQMHRFFPLHESLDEALLAAAEEDGAANRGRVREVAS